MARKMPPLVRVRIATVLATSGSLQTPDEAARELLAAGAHVVRSDDGTWNADIRDPQVVTWLASLGVATWQDSPEELTAIEQARREQQGQYAEARARAVQADQEAAS